MGQKLHKLGAFAYAHPWRIIAGWVVLLAILGFTASRFIEPTSAAISIPGTAAQKAIDRANELFPDSGKGSGRIVFKTPDGKKINDYASQINDLTAQVAKVSGVSQVVNPSIDSSFISEAGTIAYAQVQLKESTGSITEDTFTGVEKAVESARKNGLQVEIGGDLINRAPGEILGIGEVGGVVLALVVLVMTLGSLIAAGMPIITALIAIGLSMAGLFSMSQLFTISSTTPVLAVMLGLAVGIDYSLFIINKYRTYALEGYSYKEAAARAIGTAGNAVIFAAITVVIALSALSIVNIPFMTTMGLAGAGTIAVAALVAISLVPALLGLAGHSIFSKRAQVKVRAAQKRGLKKTQTLSRKTIWYKWGEMITSKPILALVIPIILIGIVAWPAKDLTLGLPTDQYAAKETSQKKAYDLLTEGFGAGFNGPLTVIVEGLPQASESEKASVRALVAQQYNQQVAAATAKQQAIFQQKAMNVSSLEQQLVLQQEVAQAETEGLAQQQAALAKVNQTIEQYTKLIQLKKVSDKVATLDNVKQAMPAVAVDDGTAGIIQVIPVSAPSDKATNDLIATIRNSSVQAELTESRDISLAVTGSVALQDDINSKLAAALPQYLAVVVGLSLILLIVAFRSILVPIKATLGFLLSVLAMFGALVAVFQWGWFGIADAPGPIVSFIPIIAIGILFGLAMDYEFFLVSSMHESYIHTKDAKKAVVKGFGTGSKVVTAAGVIMVSVFAGFVFNHDATIQAIGFALAIGIFIDAFIVRMTIVPAVMTLLGKSAWWLPKWLDKRLPHISIEGEE